MKETGGMEGRDGGVRRHLSPLKAYVAPWLSVSSADKTRCGLQRIFPWPRWVPFPWPVPFLCPWPGKRNRCGGTQREARGQNEVRDGRDG